MGKGKNFWVFSWTMDRHRIPTPEVRRGTARDHGAPWMGCTSDLYSHSDRASLPNDNGFRRDAKIKKFKQDPWKRVLTSNAVQ